MSLAFSVEGFLFYVHLHGDDKFKVNRTLFILDFGATIVFLLAVESVCLSDGSRLSDKGGGGGGGGGAVPFWGGGGGGRGVVIQILR